MGIPSYFAHIVRQHRHIIKPIGKVGQVDNLYLDANSIIYEAVHTAQEADHVQAQQQARAHVQQNSTQPRQISNQQAEQQARQAALQHIQQARQQPNDESKYVQYVCDKLCGYIKLVQPKQRVFIAFDGVAPMAKLTQQRKRRFMSAAASASASASTWNTAAITPGTLFMQALGVAVRARFANPSEFALKVIHVSAADQVGEGEHKIYSYIREEASYHKSTTTLVYGLDADLIMLTLNHLDIAPRIYLFRETPEFIKQMDRTLNPHENYILDIPEFAKRIGQQLQAPQPLLQAPQPLLQAPQPFSQADLKLVYDYIFLCFFLGNDFLPHFPALNIRTHGIARLINAYLAVFGESKGIQTLTLNKTSICWKNVRKFVEFLATHETTFIKEEYALRNNYNTKSQQHYRKGKSDEEAELPMRDRRVEHYINVEDVMWEERYYKALFDVEINDARRSEIANNYLQGLEWTLAYYGDKCPNWRWSYLYDYPPLLQDLLKFIPHQAHEMKLLSAGIATTAVTPLAQLIYVLPLKSLHLLPASLVTTLKKDYAHWYADTDKPQYQYAFCKFLWEAHVALPEIRMQDIETLLLTQKMEKL